MLSDRYCRFADVLNRGFSGYNTRWSLLALKQLLAKGDAVGYNVSDGSPALYTLFLGANDAALQGTQTIEQHVPLDEYRRNLQAIVEALKVNAAQEKGTSPPAMILITPPPLDEAAWGHFLKTVRNVSVNNRTTSQTAAYAAAVVDEGKKAGLPVIDLNTAMTTQKGVDWKSYLSDGLHLSASGNVLLFQLLIQCIADNFPHLFVALPPQPGGAPVAPGVPMHLASWDAIDPAKPENSFK